MAAKCPDRNNLSAFAIGALTGAELEHVAEHVAACSACDALLEELDDHSDALVSELRELRSGGTDLFVPDAVMIGAREAAGGRVTTDVALDPGKRYARMLRDGPCRLGKFELQAELGSGSFGHVFRARDVELDRIVAVKIQRAGRFASEEDIQRFLREARSAAQLQHPHIVALYESGQTEDGVCFLVTEHIQGETLDVRLKDRTLDAREAAALIAELAESLQYAHDHGVVHRDVKPSNVILDREGHPHVTDFGLAKRLSDDVSLTSDGRVMGTPAYVSPEQARGDSHNVDARSDTYSLGVILYELLTRERPFQGNRRLLLLQVLEDEPRPLRQLNEQVPKDLETICLKAMSKSAARRYQTSQELADDLKRYLAGEPIQARPMSRVERLWRWSRRYPMAVSVLSAVLLGSLIGFWYLSHLSSRLVEESAINSARLEADMLERINAFYSDKVVDRVDGKKVKKRHDYAERDDAIPIPATFMIDAGEYVSASDLGIEVRLFGKYHWRERAGGGPITDFDRRALAALEAKLKNGEADLSYYELAEKDGRRVVQFARGQIIKKSCMNCHKPDAEKFPGVYWDVGDLAGALTVTHPMDRDIDDTRARLSGVFVLVGGIAALFVGLTFALILTTRFRAGKHAA